MDHVRNEYKFFYTYIIRSEKSGKLYIGYTSNLRKGFKEHNDGMSRYTKGRGPFKIIYYEACINEDDARSRELYLKSGRGRRFINSRLNRFLFRT